MVSSGRKRHPEDRPCSRCGKRPPLVEFNRRKPSGTRNPTCKGCEREYLTERQERLRPPETRRPHKEWKTAMLGSVLRNDVSNHARIVTRNRPQVCFGCGWREHVNACHIKPVAAFPKEALLGVVNDTKNLLLLCPNCHWLFDHGPVLEIKGLRKEKTLDKNPSDRQQNI